MYEGIEDRICWQCSRTEQKLVIGSCFIFNCCRGEEWLHKSCVPPTVGSHVTVALPAPGGHSRVEDYWGI